MTHMTQSAALALALIVAAGTASFAQNPHAGHTMGQAQSQPAPSAGDMEQMTGAMRQMMPMMEKMRSAAPEERARMMEQMRPMMQSMMPTMMGMMGGKGGMMGQSQQGHSQQGQGATAAPAATSESTRAFEEAGAKMHRDMAVAYTGNADVDFVRSMIPHHQGAIDMAQVELRFGKDEWVKKLAEEVITAQTREIAEMRDWLSRNPR